MHRRCSYCGQKHSRKTLNPKTYDLGAAALGVVGVHAPQVLPLHIRRPLRLRHLRGLVLGVYEVWGGIDNA